MNFDEQLTGEALDIPAQTRTRQPGPARRPGLPRTPVLSTIAWPLYTPEYARLAE